MLLYKLINNNRFYIVDDFEYAKGKQNDNLKFFKLLYSNKYVIEQLLIF